MIILGVITFPKIPVSLLPDIAIPEITVQINYPSASAKELNQTITKPILNQLQQVNHLSDIEAESRDGFAVLKLTFDFGTNINLAYIEANEKIDAITGSLPRDLTRPLVIKAGAADIPVFNLNVWESSASQLTKDNDLKVSDNSFLQLSEFAENVLKRRIEQTREVALVDITGLTKAEVAVIPNQATMQSLGISEQELANILQENNIDLGNFVVKDGQYQYNIRFSSVLKTIEDIENIFFKKGNRVLQVKQLASVKFQEQKLRGIYKYNGNRAICMSIIKQSDTQLLNLQKELDKEIDQYKKDYPQLSFAISQNQTELLNVAINNLTGNILFGGLCTLIMMFFFMNDLRTPFLVGLVLPISLIITFLFFYLFSISINIVSLAGLVLGVGEIIDSAIIVIENIEDHRSDGTSLETSCINGTEEVIRPLFTSILTNSAVFLPLLFMSGLAGALFYDQALAVTLSLTISLLCSYTLIPVLYRLFYKNQTLFKPKTTFVTRKANEAYDWLFEKVFKHKKKLILFFVIGGLSFIPFFMLLKKQGMPIISHTELEAKIDWNEPITVQENDKRLVELIKTIKTKINYESSFVGQQQFLLNKELQQNYNESLLSIKVESSKAFEQLKSEIGSHLKANYPNAIAEIRPTKNIFEQLFNSSEIPLRVKITSNTNSNVPNIDVVSNIYKNFEKNQLNTNSPALEKRIFVRINPEKLLLYDVDYEAVYQKLKTIFNENIVGNLKSEQKYIPILISDNSQKTNENIQNASVKTIQGNFISLNQLIEFSTQQDYKSYYQSKEGSYIPFDFANENVVESQEKVQEIIKLFPNVSASYSGIYFKNQKLINELLLILLVAIGLLYFILTAQFESLTQPLIVMLTLFYGLGGAIAMLFLWGNSLNIMSAIGMIVLIGILDNDSILKIDTMNRSANSVDLISAIKFSGKKRLKSQLMTFLTTILGLLPILFSDGLGSELQKPLALSVIGGMCLGLFISLSLIPLLYWQSNKSNLQLNKVR